MYCKHMWNVTQVLLYKIVWSFRSLVQQYVLACILEACKLVSVYAQMSNVDFFPALSSLEDVTVDQLGHELESRRGKHPKLTSLSSDENFCSGLFVIRHL